MEWKKENRLQKLEPMKKVWNGVRVYCRRVVRSAGRYASCSSWRGRITVCLSTARRCSRSYDDSAQCNRQTPDQSSYTAGTLNKLLSSEILKICAISTLYYSRTKGAMIETYNIHSEPEKKRGSIFLTITLANLNRFL